MVLLTEGLLIWLVAPCCCFDLGWGFHFSWCGSFTNAQNDYKDSRRANGDFDKGWEEI